LVEFFTDVNNVEKEAARWPKMIVINPSDKQCTACGKTNNNLKKYQGEYYCYPDIRPLMTCYEDQWIGTDKK